MQKSKKTIKKGVMPAALTGAIKRKNEQASKPPVQKTIMPGGLRAGQAGVPKSPAPKSPVKKGAIGAGIGAVAGSPLGPLGMAGGAALGSKLGGNGKKEKAPEPEPVQNSKEKKPVQKLLPALAAGAIGGKLLGLSDNKPIQKLLPALAAGAIGGKLLGLSKKKHLPVQKFLGELISGIGGAAGSIGLQEEDEEEIEKHRGKSFHSHKRKNPFLRRRK